MLRSLVLAFIILVSSLMPAFASKRAFVVGINRYDNLSPRSQLLRAINDARAVARTLRAVGYSVSLKDDLSRSTFFSAWQTFLNAVEPGDEVALFFAGHGIEIDGQNFLLPRDIPNVQYGRETQVKRESISLQELLSDLRTRRPRVSLIILDACRDHPLASPDTRSAAVAGGLANVHPPEGTFIMYSAGAGETALDRLPYNDPDANHSVYTRNLLPLLKMPGLSLTEMAVRVRRSVFELTQQVPHVQRPAYYDGVIGRYCVAGCKSTPESAAAGLAKGSTAAPLQHAPHAPDAQLTSRSPAAASCTQIGRDLDRQISLSVGLRFCGTSDANNARVEKIANRYVVFLVNGAKRLTCQQGQLCAFDWPEKPLFRIEAQADAALGIAPSGRMLPR